MIIVDVTSNKFPHSALNSIKYYIAFASVCLLGKGCRERFPSSGRIAFHERLEYSFRHIIPHGERSRTNVRFGQKKRKSILQGMKYPLEQLFLISNTF